MVRGASVRRPSRWRFRTHNGPFLGPPHRRKAHAGARSLVTAIAHRQGSKRWRRHGVDKGRGPHPFGEQRCNAALEGRPAKVGFIAPGQLDVGRSVVLSNETLSVSEVHRSSMDSLDRYLYEPVNAHGGAADVVAVARFKVKRPTEPSTRGVLKRGFEVLNGENGVQSEKENHHESDAFRSIVLKHAARHAQSRDADIENHCSPRHDPRRGSTLVQHHR